VNSLDRSLRALGHPLTLASVALLVLNDHLFKRAYPSVLTGKLSDFTGLFFFPYLLIALLGLAGLALARLPFAAGERRRAGAWTHSVSGYGAYLLTACLFAAVKLYPALNAAVNGLLQSFFGLPVQIARDPTDLVALLALLPSYRLWSSSASSFRRPPLRRSLAALGLASLAALATAPCPPEQPITHLISHDGRLYALATAWQPVSNAYLDTDQGRLWDNLDPETLPAPVLESAAVPVALPKTVCVPGLEQVCYRAAGDEQLEVSEDGGQTWQVAWSLPASRRVYMERVASGYGQMLACGKPLDLSANDIAVLGEGQSHVVIVALGNEGVLRGPDRWTRVGVGWAEPTPERGGIQDLVPPMLILGETGIALAGGAAAFLLLSAIAWARLETGMEPTPDPRGRRSPWTVAIIIDFVLLTLMVLANLEELIATVLPPLLGLTAVITAMLIRWRRAFRRSERPADAGRSVRVAVQCGLLVSAAAWLPFALWVLDLIPGYSAALMLAILAAAVITTWCIGRLPKASRPMPSTDHPLS
jgi:hypothetical protein